MKFRDWLKKWELTSLKINTGFLEAEMEFNNADKKAAWELYVELLTRITTQPLDNKQGDEQTALSSVHSLFAITREVLKKYGTGCANFTKIAIVILNQVIRPFTAKWHKKTLECAFKKSEECSEFRKELQSLQEKIRKYTKLLSDIAGVEDLTKLEQQ
jgi:hypothetical protein